MSPSRVKEVRSHALALLLSILVSLVYYSTVYAVGREWKDRGANEPRLSSRRPRNVSPPPVVNSLHHLADRAPPLSTTRP